MAQKMTLVPEARLPAQLPPVLTIKEVATFLRCSLADVCHLIAGKVIETKPLPAIKLGRRTLVRKESLASWLDTVESSW